MLQRIMAQRNSTHRSSMNYFLTQLRYRESQSGYVLLLSVVIIGVVASSIAATILLLGIGTQRTSLAVQEGQAARHLADSCAQEVIERLIQNTAYTGSETLTFNGESCAVGPVTGSGDANRVIHVTGVSGDATARVAVTVTTVGPPVVIGSWQEVAGF